MAKIKALVLAAGFSSRMGRNKMLLPFADSTVIESTAQAFLKSDLNGVAVVLGNEKEKIQQILAPYPIQFIENCRFAQGMSTSLREGIKCLMNDPELDGVMISPGDMPFMKQETINFILEKFQETSYPIIIPQYQGKKGHPVLFARSLFPQLMEISGDMGARDVVRQNFKQCLLLEVNDPGILIDIDSPEEYARWNKQGKPF